MDIRTNVIVVIQQLSKSYTAERTFSSHSRARYKQIAKSSIGAIINTKKIRFSISAISLTYGTLERLNISLRVYLINIYTVTENEKIPRETGKSTKKVKQQSLIVAQHYG
jgi:hypothetical protein